MPPTTRPTRTKQVPELTFVDTIQQPTSGKIPRRILSDEDR